MAYLTAFPPAVEFSLGYFPERNNYQSQFPTLEKGQYQPCLFKKPYKLEKYQGSNHNSLHTLPG